MLGRVTTDKVIALLEELSKTEFREIQYHENKDTEIAGTEDVGQNIRKCAKDLIRKWNNLEA